MRRISRRYFLEAAGVMAAAPAIDLASAQSTANAPSIAVEKDVVFGKGGARMAALTSSIIAGQLPWPVSR